MGISPWAGIDVPVSLVRGVFLTCSSKFPLCELWRCADPKAEQRKVQALANTEQPLQKQRPPPRVLSLAKAELLQEPDTAAAAGGWKAGGAGGPRLAPRVGAPARRPPLVTGLSAPSAGASRQPQLT